MHRHLALALVLSSACGGSAPPHTLTWSRDSPPPDENESSPDTIDGVVRSLGEPATRSDAVERLSILYTQELSGAEGDRSAPGPQTIVGVAVDPLVSAYLEDSTVGGEAILTLLMEMRTERAWPAYEAALAWRSDVTEEHAIIAAQALRRVRELESVDAHTRASAAARALLRIEGARPVDNRMRLHLIGALGEIRDPASVDALQQVVARLDEDQNFLINRLAAEALGELADPGSVSTFVLSLFHFAPNRPDMRMNDVAAAGLVQIGRPSLEPALALLRGENAEALAIARQYVDAVRAVDAEAASRLNAETIVRNEAMFVLGQLGFTEGLEPLLAEARRGDAERRLNAAIALVSVSGLPDRDATRVRSALQRVYGALSETIHQAQLLNAILHTYDGGHLRFLVRLARRASSLPDVRIIAFRAAAMLAAGAEAAPLRGMFAGDAMLEPAAAEWAPALEAAQRCDHDVDCWRGLLEDDEPIVVQKAATMLARLAVGDDDTITALIAQLEHSDISVRGDVLYALDRISVAGSEPLVRAIEDLREREEGRSSWNQIEQLAMAIRGRQRLRLR